MKLKEVEKLSIRIRRALLTRLPNGVITKRSYLARIELGVMPNPY